MTGPEVPGAWHSIWLAPLVQVANFLLKDRLHMLSVNHSTLAVERARLPELNLSVILANDQPFLFPYRPRPRLQQLDLSEVLSYLQIGILLSVGSNRECDYVFAGERLNLAGLLVEYILLV